MGAPTRIQDIIDPEVLADQISAKYPDYLVLGQSNLVEVDGTFPMGSPGTAFTIPFWKRITGFSPYSEGSAASTTRITSGTEKAIVERAIGAWEVYDTAALVSKADPMSEIASQVSRRLAEYIDGKLVTKLEKTPNVHNITAASTTTLNQDVIADAVYTKLGDNGQSLLGTGALIVHSKVFNDLVKVQAIQNQYQSGMDVIRTGIIPTVMGLPVFVSDRCTTATVSSVVHYNSYIVGPGALGLFYQRNVMVEFDRDILGLSDIMQANVHFATHLFGWDDDTNAQVAEDAKSIRAVVITSK